MLRVGVIGAGAMGRHHVRIYSGLSDVELVGVADRENNQVSSIAREFNTKVYTDYNQLLEQGLDAVTIAVPTSIHREVATAAAGAKVNILLEKPIADTIKNAREIIDECKRNRVMLMIGHVERFNPVFSVIKQAIANLQIISIDITRVGPFPPRVKDVGVVVDLAVHDIDILRYLTGSEFKQIQSLVTGGLNNNREDTALLSFEMENGILCHITTNWLTPFKVREINIATRERFIKGWLMEQKVCEYESLGDSNSYKVSELSIPRGEPLKLEIEAFLKAVKNDEQPPVTGEDGLRALEIALQCLEFGGRH